MKIFKYKCLDNDGNIVKSSVELSNQVSFRQYIKDNKLYLITYKIVEESWLLSLLKRTKLNNKELLMLFVHMHQLISSGVSIIESLADIQQSSS